MASLPNITQNITQTPSATGRAEETGFAWTVHLSRRQPRRTGTLIAAAVGALALGLCIFHSLWLGALPALALLFSLSEFLFPVRYTLTAQSASVRHGLTSLEIAWKNVRHAYLTPDGIKLSPLSAKNSRFEPLRGVFLRFDAGNREAVMDAVRRLRAEA